MAIPLTEAAALFASKLAGVRPALQQAAEASGALIEAEAKSAIGTYIYGWPALAPSTLARKAANTPLLETGVLQASITHHVEDLSSHVGTDDRTAVWHEHGTSKMPPRPFIGPALVHAEAAIHAELERTLIEIISPGGRA